MFERLRHLGLLCFETPGEGAGGAGGQQRLTAAELLARYGASPERLAEKLEQAYTDNFSLRDKNRGLTTEVETLTKAKVPEGATVLTGTQAQAWQAFSELGKPDEVKAKLAERDTLATEVTTIKRNETLREVAEAAGWNPAPLRRIGAEREYELREQTADGKTTKVPFIKDGDTFKPLAEYAASEWADIIPALEANRGGGNGYGGGGGNGTGQGVVYPRQGAGNGQPANPGMSYLTSAYKGPPQRGG
jgi:hypothetical protein